MQSDLADWAPEKTDKLWMNSLLSRWSLNSETAGKRRYSFVREMRMRTLICEWSLTIIIALRASYSRTKSSRCHHVEMRKRWRWEDGRIKKSIRQRLLFIIGTVRTPPDEPGRGWDAQRKKKENTKAKKKKQLRRCAEERTVRRRRYINNGRATKRGGREE